MAVSASYLYPKDDEGRIAYWRRQLEYAESRMRPLFRASDVLVKQYENRASTEREQNSEANYLNEPHISRIKSNLIFGWLDQSVANLLERRPAFAITPEKKDSEKGAPVVAAISNYWYRETNQLHQDERCLLDAFLCPYAVKKLGWTTDIEAEIQDAVEAPEYDFGDDVEAENGFLVSGEPAFVGRGQDHRLHIDAHVAMLEDPLIPNDIADLVDLHIEQHKRMVDQPEPDANKDVQWQAPYGVRWNPKDFLIDPLAQDGINDARWVAFRWRRPVDDVLANPNYRNTDGLEPSSRMADAPGSDPMGGDDFGLVTGWEIWARDFPVGNRKRKDLLIVMAEGHDRLLRHDDEWPYRNIENYPVELLTFHFSVDNWVTKPSLVLAGADNIQALANEILDSYLMIIRKQKTHVLFDADVVTGDWMDNLLEAPDMSASGVRGLSKMPGNPVRTVDFGSVPGEKGDLLSLITGLFDRAAGTPQPIAQPLQDTATEASIFERRNTARENRKANLLAEFQTRVARKFWQMTTQFRPRRAFLVHPLAGEWMDVTEEIATGEYRFRIDIASQSNAIALERKNWLDLLNLSAGLAGIFNQQYQSSPDLSKIFEHLLVRGYNIQNPEEILPMLKGKEEGNDQEKMMQAAMAGQGMPGAEPPATPGAAPAPGQGTTAPAPMSGGEATGLPPELALQTGGRLAPSMEGPPAEVTEAGAGPGPALPRLYNKQTPSAANMASQAQGV